MALYGAIKRLLVASTVLEPGRISKRKDKKMSQNLRQHSGEIPALDQPNRTKVSSLCC